jgi:cysteinyl-tRNA synthetase
MSLQLHNTLTQKTEPFAPLSADKVTLYTCGPTVYNHLHVGNWFGYIMWDVLVRTLKANDLHVERVMNITDVGHLTGENEGDADKGEDKLEKGARREGKSAWDVAAFYTEDFLEGMKKLGMVMPDHITKATEYIPQQLDLVRTLKTKGYTYQIDDGIYFDTSKFPTYAEFAHLDLAAQKAGARVEFNPEKRNPSDFALWKFTPSDEKRAMEWETPEDLLEQGIARKVTGFPGWHLECSAMAMAILGDTIDIHTGGIDHIPVHHTNEIAQSEAATDKLFSRFWLHNNHLKSEGTKISKSLGNGYTLQDLEARGFSPMDFRMFVLQSQYSNESNFTWDNLEAAKNRLHHWRNTAALRWQTHDTLKSDASTLAADTTISLYGASQAIIEALNDDMNTPEALRIIDQAFSQFDGKSLAHLQQGGLAELLHTVDSTLGLALVASTPDISDENKQRIIERNRVRETKDWAASDALRDGLIKEGIALRDTSGGSIWEYAE